MVTVSVSRQHADLNNAITFLQEAQTRLKGRATEAMGHQNAIFLLRIGQADKKLSLGLYHDCHEILTEVRDTISTLSDIDAKVFAQLASVQAQYYRRKDDYENFYKSGLTFLAYTPDEDLNPSEKQQWSIKLGMAVLLGKKIFNIQELLDKPMFKSLV